MRRSVIFRWSLGAEYEDGKGDGSEKSRWQYSGVVKPITCMEFVQMSDKLEGIWTAAGEESRGFGFSLVIALNRRPGKEVVAIDTPKETGV